MAKQVQFRRGTTAQLSSVTGVEGELFVDTTKDTLTVHDGYQAGGFPLLREDLNNLANNTINITKLQHGSATAGQLLTVNSAANGLEFAAPAPQIEIFQFSLDNPGSTSNGSYIGGSSGKFSFTPTFNCKVSLGWTYAYRHSTATHAYLIPQILNADDSIRYSGITYGRNYGPYNNPTWNHGSGGVTFMDTALTAGTTYKAAIKLSSGANINQSTDIGHDLHFNVMCVPT